MDLPLSGIQQQAMILAKHYGSTFAGRLANFPAARGIFTGVTGRMASAVPGPTHHRAQQDHPVFLYAWIGCHPNRDTLTAITRAPFEVTTVRHLQVPKALRVERPMIVSAATRHA